MGDENVLQRILSGLQKPTNLKLELLREVTKNFSEERKVGTGGFGEVYKGVLQNWNVAVKRIIVSVHTLDDKLFDREVKNLIKIISHPNVVRFLGFCANTHREAIEDAGSADVVLAQIRERILCFEYIGNGSLDKHITDELRGLEWSTRYEIIKGICHGLHYLHENHIIHMDLKPGNIMLDNEMVPKITDFGLSRLDKHTHTSGTRFTTQGYCAPEYENEGKTSNKADIYSLGVIITELVTGRRALPSNIHNVLRRWRHRWNKSPTSLQYIQVEKCMEVALKCRKQEPEGRPDIQVVLADLRKIESEEVQTGQISLLPDDDMLRIEPLELRFPFELQKQIWCEVKLTNETKDYYAFKIEMPCRQYLAQPNKGIVSSQSMCSVQITTQALETAPPDITYADGFVVQSTQVNGHLRTEDISKHMCSGKVDEVNLTTVVYDPKKPLGNVSAEAVSKGNERGQCPKQLDSRNFLPPENFSSNYPTNMKYLEKAIDRAVDVTAGAMGSLLHKLGELLEGGFNLDASVRDDVESLSDELYVMRETLRNRKVSEVEWDNLDSMLKRWVSHVRELSYDIEDVVDGFLVQDEPAANTDGFRELTHQMLNLFETGRNYHQISDVIKDIKLRVKKVADRRGKYRVDSALANPTTATTIDPCLSALYKNRREIVGIDDKRDELTKRLADGDGDVPKQQLKIVSIFGSGGLGKTTLAKAVYDKLQTQYEYKAFVPVGRNPELKKVLKDILLEVGETRPIDYLATLNEKQLIDKLRKLLENARYFIVIDDVWDLEAWKIIKCALLDNNRGSRVITTTRKLEIATRSGDLYKLKPLSDDLSKELFYTKLFGGKDKWPYDPPAKISEKVVEKCGGVPLAIITIARLLAGKPMKDWSEIYTSIGFGFEEDKLEEDNTRKILSFSYYDLPSYLRPCLLHLSIFPEDSLIMKDTIIWMWAAESFINEEPGVGLYEIGERYFWELINRSMILPVATDLNEIVDAFQVHDMVLDMICSISIEQNFVTILGRNGKYLSSQGNARRLAVQTRDEEQHNPLANSSMPKLRSCYANSCKLSIMTSLPSFLVLRVLHLEKCSFLRDCHLEHLGRLLQLRYLSLKGTIVSMLPKEVGDLKFLQTLDLRDTKIEELPQSIGLLRKVKRLCISTRGVVTKVSSWVGNLTSLECLITTTGESSIFVKELRKLTELRVLNCTWNEYLDEFLMKTFVESLCNLRKIQELQLYGLWSKLQVDTYWECYEPPGQLRDLVLSGKFSRLPAWINSSFLPYLSNLDVQLSVVEEQDVVNLGRLPELRTLGESLFIGADIEFPDGAFPKLTSCWISAPFRFLQGSMQSLVRIEFDVGVRRLKDANTDFDFIGSSLGNLPLLHRVEAILDCRGARATDVDGVEAAVMQVTDTHPNRPLVDIGRDYEKEIIDDYEEEESDYEQTDEESIEDDDEEGEDELGSEHTEQELDESEDRDAVTSMEGIEEGAEEAEINKEADLSAHIAGAANIPKRLRSAVECSIISDEPGQDGPQAGKDTGSASSEITTSLIPKKAKIAVDQEMGQADDENETAQP